MRDHRVACQGPPGEEPPGKEGDSTGPEEYRLFLPRQLSTSRTRECCKINDPKGLQVLDNFIDPYPADGGCDEGPSYWGRAGASLFDCLELIAAATAGRIDVYGDDKIRHIGQYIYRVQIAGDYFLNFADASATVSHSPALVYRYGERIGDRAMMAFGAWLASRTDLVGGGLRDTITRLLPAVFSGGDIAATQARQPLPRDGWMEEIQVMTGRDVEGSSAGLYVAAKGGCNDESHNHNDIGNFVVYIDGEPLVVDAGVETYTRQTFSHRRYEIWTMRSSYHTLLPTIDGVEQAPGSQFRARDVACAVDEATAAFALDMAPAYPDAAGVERWQRRIVLHRGSHIDVTDDYALARDAAQIALSFLTPCAVDVSQPGTIRLTRCGFGQGRHSGAGQVAYPADLQVACEPVPITDERMGRIWGGELRRVILTISRPPRAGVWHYRIAPYS